MHVACVCDDIVQTLYSNHPPLCTLFRHSRESVMRLPMPSKEVSVEVDLKL